jgi:hypothetical protein
VEYTLSLRKENKSYLKQRSVIDEIVALSQNFQPALLTVGSLFAFSWPFPWHCAAQRSAQWRRQLGISKRGLGCLECFSSAHVVLRA